MGLQRLFLLVKLLSLPFRALSIQILGANQQIFDNRCFLIQVARGTAECCCYRCCWCCCIAASGTAIQQRRDRQGAVAQLVLAVTRETSRNSAVLRRSKLLSSFVVRQWFVSSRLFGFAAHVCDDSQQNCPTTANHEYNENCCLVNVLLLGLGMTGTCIVHNSRVLRHSQPQSLESH